MYRYLQNAFKNARGYMGGSSVLTGGGTGPLYFWKLMLNL